MEKTQNFRDAPKSVLKTFLSDIFINDSRIVKNHFQHTLKVPETLSEHQGMSVKKLESYDSQK